MVKDSNEYVIINADTSKQLIPKAGIKIDKERFYFDSYQRKLDHEKIYRAKSENKILYFKIIGK